MNIIPVVHHLIFSDCDWFKLLMCCDSVFDTLMDFLCIFKPKLKNDFPF